jgi:hypothetical protein
MIYLFGQGHHVSVVYDGNSLSEQAKKDAVKVDKLPETKTPPEHEAILCLDASNKPFWRYEPKPKDTLEELVRKEVITKEQYKTLTGKDFTF